MGLVSLSNSCQPQELAKLTLKIQRPGLATTGRAKMITPDWFKYSLIEQRRLLLTSKAQCVVV